MSILKTWKDQRRKNHSNSSGCIYIYIFNLSMKGVEQITKTQQGERARNRATIGRKRLISWKTKTMDRENISKIDCLNEQVRTLRLNCERGSLNKRGSSLFCKSVINFSSVMNRKRKCRWYDRGGKREMKRNIILPFIVAFYSTSRRQSSWRYETPSFIFST